MAEDVDHDPRIIAAPSVNLTLGPILTDSRRAHRVERVARNMDAVPLIRIFTHDAVKRAGRGSRVAGDDKMGVHLVRKDGFRGRKHALREVTNLVEHNHDVLGVEAS